MTGYILRRLLLMIPTIFGIMAISFAIVQFAPGGPVERIIAQLQGHDAGATARFTTVNDGAMATALFQLRQPPISEGGPDGVWGSESEWAAGGA